MACPHSPRQQRGEQEAGDLLKMADRNPSGQFLQEPSALITEAMSARLHRCTRGLFYVVSKLICDENVASLVSKLHI